MNSLKSELISDTDSFEHLARKLMSKKIVSQGKEYITSLKAEFFVKPRDLLSSFMIYKFPDDSIGPPELESNKNVIDSAKMFIECEEADQKKNLVKFIHHFKKWKESDKEVLESQLFNEYHQLTVDILNTDDPDKKLVYETVQGEIEKVAGQVGGMAFVEKIKSYAPVLLNLEELKTQYNQAHYDMICEEYEKGNVEKVKEMFSFIKNICKQLNSKDTSVDEIMDVDFIIQRLENKSYTDDELLSLFDYMFGFIQGIQASRHDEDLEMAQKEMHNEKINVPKILFVMIDFVKRIVADIEGMKENK